MTATHALVEHRVRSDDGTLIAYRPVGSGPSISKVPEVVRKRPTDFFTSDIRTPEGISSCS